MSDYHFHVTQIKRGKGQSAVACAAYRSGEKLYSDYYGEVSDYTRKRGIVHAEILLPTHAPPEFSNRQTLWNSVEKAEPHPKAQLAYSFDIALQNEFSMEENIALARQFLLNVFVSRGMICDFAVHLPDRKNGIQNPHFHVLCPMKTDGGEQNKGEYIAWTKTEIRFLIRTVSRFSMLFRLPTGAVPKLWSIGERRGATFAIQSLQKRVLTCVSTTAVMSGRALNSYRPYTKVRPSELTGGLRQPIR